MANPTDRRPLKFRQPIMDDNKFHHWHYWGFLDEKCFTGLASVIAPNFQYIGLRDICKKEIYEGDICQYKDPVTKEPREKVLVIWMRSPAAFSPMYAEGLEIIGNIYESPELLLSINSEGRK